MVRRPGRDDRRQLRRHHPAHDGCRPPSAPTSDRALIGNLRPLSRRCLSGRDPRVRLHLRLDRDSEGGRHRLRDHRGATAPATPSACSTTFSTRSPTRASRTSSRRSSSKTPTSTTPTASGNGGRQTRASRRSTFPPPPQPVAGRAAARADLGLTRDVRSPPQGVGQLLERESRPRLLQRHRRATHPAVPRPLRARGEERLRAAGAAPQCRHGDEDRSGQHERGSLLVDQAQLARPEGEATIVLSPQGRSNDPRAPRRSRGLGTATPTRVRRPTSPSPGPPRWADRPAS